MVLICVILDGLIFKSEVNQVSEKKILKLKYFRKNTIQNNRETCWLPTSEAQIS